MTAISRRTAAAVSAAVLSALLAAGCATPQADALRASPPVALAAPRLLAHVPFYPQDEYQCGPAALAMALAASGAPADPEALREQVYVPARQGSLQPEMLATARRHGRLAVEIPPRMDAALAEVAGGLPVIVLQNLALPVSPVWHYAVIVGFDLARGEVVLHSGRSEHLTLSLEVFERTWARSGYWAMVASAPGVLPQSVPMPALLAAAAALERVDAAAARRAYAALTARDPKLAAAWFGLGNASFAAGDYAAARDAFERSVQVAPAHADAWNNLAHTWLALQQPAEAIRAAQRAVTLGGPRLERYQQTLAAAERGQ